MERFYTAKALEVQLLLGDNGLLTLPGKNPQPCVKDLNLIATKIGKLASNLLGRLLQGDFARSF